MYVTVVKPWKPNTGDPWPRNTYKRYAWHSPSGAYRLIADSNPINSYYHSGGYDIIERAPSIKHRVNGEWLARPYMRRIVNQPITRSRCERAVESGSHPTYRIDEGPIGNTADSSWWLLRLRHDGKFSSEYSSLRAQAETECLAKLSSGEVNIGSALAESRQTVQMIAERAAKLSNAMVFAQSRSFSKAAKELGVSYTPRSNSRSRTLASNWLELQYGWLPLMGDIYGLCQELKKSLSKGQTVRATRKVSTQFSLPYKEPDPAWYTNLSFDWNLGVTVNLVAKVDNPTLARLNSLGLINPATVAWERMPWSFVVDWFIPVSTFLQALSATIGLDFFTGSVTYRTFARSKGAWPFIVSTVPSRNWAIEAGEANASGMMVKRVVLTDFPRPILFLNQSPFSTKRALNAIALVVQNQRILR